MTGALRRVAYSNLNWVRYETEPPGWKLLPRRAELS